MSKRTISEARMRRYFLGSGVYTNALILIILGVGIIAASFAIHSLIVGLAGGGLILLGGMIFLMLKMNAITDYDYDHWVAGQRAEIEATALQRLSMDKSQLIGDPLVLHGVIPPDSPEAEGYSETYKKKGTDMGFRYSVNIYTYFFPAEDHIAVFCLSKCV